MTIWILYSYFNCPISHLTLNIANDVTNPKKLSEWSIETDGKEEKDELNISESFNNYFVKKIFDLKEGIDKTQTVDPLEKLSERMKNNKSTFNLKKVSEMQVEKTLKSMKKKKSAGMDGISQENLINGAKVLVTPLTEIVNKVFTVVLSCALICHLAD